MDAIVIFGIQGSGKGTQALLLSKRLSYQHINIGDALRAQVSGETELGKAVKLVIEAGSLVDDDLVFQLIEKTIDTNAKGIVFDGFPRTLAQAQYLSDIFRVRTAIYLDLSETEAMRRMTSRWNCPSCKATYNEISQPPQNPGKCDQCGTSLIQRVDDSPEAIHQRFAQFYQQTFPLIEFFRSMGILYKVDASSKIEEIEAQICKLVIKA